MKKSLSKKLIGALLAELASGQLLENDRFFSNRKICRLWNVSETTAKKALAWLVESGLIVVRDRSGYYVIPGSQERALFLLHREAYPRLATPENWDTRRHSLRLRAVPPSFRIAIVRPGESPAAQHSTEKLSSCPELRGLFLALRREAVECCYCIDNQTTQSREEIGHLIRQHEVHGVVAFRRNKEQYLPLEPLIRTIGSTALPVVTVLDDCEGLNVVSINVNNIALGYRAARHFLKNGHRRIAVVYPNRHNRYYYDRVIGCRMALEGESDVTLQEIPEASLFKGDQKNARYFASAASRPTALFLTSYDQIRPVLDLLKRRRLKIPDDVSLLVCRRTSTPPDESGIPLDALAVPFETLGRKAAESIMALLKGTPIPRTNLVDATLVRAGSVRKLC